MIYDIRKNPKSKKVWEYRDSKGNILKVDSSNVDLKSKSAKKRLEAVGYDGPGDWESA